MKVIVRVRPLNQRETVENCSVVVRTQGNTLQVFDDVQIDSKVDNQLHHFSFDRCYSPTDPQQKVCEELANDVIEPVVAGYNASLIVYGQAGTGKTYTTGISRLHAQSAVDCNVLHIFTQKLLSLAQCPDTIARFEVSLMEVYNDHVIDLLSGGIRSCLKVREHPKSGPYVQGLSKHLVNHYNDVAALLQYGMGSSAYGSPTSHIIFTWTFTEAKFTEGMPSEVARKINIVDMADRRPVYASKISLEDRKKADSINRSLLTFCNVITWLADSVDSRLGCVRRRRRSVYIPYCDSAFTWLLKDSIGVNSSSVLLATVSPTAYDVTSTLNTLKLASGARSIANKPVINEEMNVIKIKELVDANNVLRVTLGETGLVKHRSFLPLKQFMEAREKLKHNEELIRSLTIKWINKWAALVGSVGADRETVKRWKDFEKASGISANDSAFGSDPEQEHDSRSFSDECEKPKTDNSYSDPVSCRSVPRESAANYSEPYIRRTAVTTGLATPSVSRRRLVHSSNDVTSSTAALDRRLQEAETNSNINSQLPAADQPSASSRSSSLLERLERDKAEALARRTRLRQTRRPDSTYDPGYAVTGSRGGGRWNVDVASRRHSVGLDTTDRQPEPTTTRAAAAAAAADTVGNGLQGTAAARSSAEDSSPVTQLFRHLSEQLGQVRSVVSDTIQRKYDYYTNFPDQLSPSVIDGIANQLTSLKTVVDYTEKLLEGGCNSVRGQLCRDRLVYYRSLLASVSKFVEVQRLLRNVDDNLRRPTKTYSDLVDDLDRLDVLLASLDLGQPLERQSCQVLQIELCIMRQRVLRELTDAWNSLLQWELPSTDDDNDLDLPSSLSSTTTNEKLPTSGPRTATLNLTGLSRRSDVAAAVASASSRLGRLNADVATFCDRLLNRFVAKVTRDSGTTVKVVVDGADRRTATVETPPSADASGRPSAASRPGEVFDKLEQIFAFLGDALSDVKIVTPAGGRGGDSLSGRVGETVISRVLDCVYADCLSHVVQSADTEWPTLDKIASLAERFEVNLRRHLRLAASNDEPDAGVDAADRSTAAAGSLTERLAPVCRRAAAERCGRLLAAAHELITRDMAESVLVSVDCPLGQLLDGRMLLEEFVHGCRQQAATATYRMPTCRVSVSIRDLVCLAYDTLKEAVEGSRQGALILSGALRDVFELYCDVMPFYHRDRISTLSLFAALHHNNCMFVAHHLITIEKVFKQKLSAPDSDATSTNNDEDVAGGRMAAAAAGGGGGKLVAWVKRLGNDSFTQFIISKKHQLTELLSRTQQGFSCIADDRGKTASKGFGDVMEQLKSIAGDWADVLPQNGFFRSLGSLLNTALKDIITSVLSVDEYSVDDCSCLQHVLTTLTADVISLFQTVSSSTGSPPPYVVRIQVTLQECVPLWMKFGELTAFFGLSLAEVTDRWADGKGPLAMHATGSEVARLVVAVFEKTSARDQLIQLLQRKPSVHVQI